MIFLVLKLAFVKKIVFRTGCSNGGQDVSNFSIYQYFDLPAFDRLAFTPLAGWSPRRSGGP
jgi:hypothetical protein